MPRKGRFHQRSQPPPCPFRSKTRPRQPRTLGALLPSPQDGVMATTASHLSLIRHPSLALGDGDRPFLQCLHPPLQRLKLLLDIVADIHNGSEHHDKADPFAHSVTSPASPPEPWSAGQVRRSASSCSKCSR